MIAPRQISLYYEPLTHSKIIRSYLLSTQPFNMYNCFWTYILQYTFG